MERWTEQVSGFATIRRDRAITQIGQSRKHYPDVLYVLFWWYRAGGTMRVPIIVELRA